MEKFFDRLKQILSYRSTGIIFLIIAIAVKISMQFVFFSIAGDKSYQLVAAKNFLAGHGITLNQVFLNDLSSEKFIPLVGWPPGYSVAVSPLLWIFNNNYKTAALVFDIICVFPFFFYLLRLANYLRLQKWLANLFILFSGVFFYPADSNTCTDFISLSCILAGFYYLLVFMRDNKGSLHLIFLISISLFLAGFFRYNYILVAFVFPFLLGIAGIINKNKKWISGGIQIGFALGIMLFSLLLFQHYYTGAATYINSKQTGFFPKNLLQMYPFVPASFFNVEIALSGFTNFFGGGYLENGKLLLYINYILLIFLLFCGTRWVIKKKFLLEKESDRFTYIGFGVCLSIFLLLVYLSLRNSSNLSPFYHLWTYVQEFRYFVFIILFIQLLCFVYLFNQFESLSRFWKSIAILCSCLILLQSAHRVYYVINSVSSMSLINDSIAFKKETEPIIQKFKDAAADNPNYEIIVASPDINVCNYAALENMKVVYNPSPLSLAQPIAVARPVKILVAIPENMITLYSASLDNNSTHFFGNSLNQYFYILDVSSKQQ